MILNLFLQIINSSSINLEMGKPTLQPDQSSTTPRNISSPSSSINHFSHPHPLHLSQHAITGNSSSLCSGCKLEASGMIYSCTICNYFLHKKCSQMPQQITHPFDHQNHVLSLHTKPVYAEGLFNCDACGLQGDGFCYHCKVCGIDLHILCASSPLNFTHQYHHHQLQLTFSAPYPGKMFSCDMCGMNGCNIWLYRCDMCQFDAHLTCVNKQFGVTTRQNPHLFPQNSMPNNFRGSVNPQPHLFPQHSMPNNFISHVPQVIGTPFVRAPTVQNYGVPANNFSNAGAFRPARPAGNGLVNQLVGGVANGIASGASQAIAGALIQGLMGGGGDGGNNGGGIDVGYGDGIDGGYGGGMDGGDPNSASNY